jgi:hypothetical protein
MRIAFSKGIIANKVPDLSECLDLTKYFNKKTTERKEET